MNCWVCFVQHIVIKFINALIFLLVRIIKILGTELPVEIYKETQRIEADGGMMIRVTYY